MAQNVIITKSARKKMVQARAGAITLPKIVGMAFGSGGVDSAGNVISPSETQTALKKELLRKPISGYNFITETTCRYECTLGESELADSISVKLGCMMPTAILFVSRPLPERERITILK